MKVIPTLLLTLIVAASAGAQSPTGSPTAASKTTAAAASGAAAMSDIYHIHFAKAAVGKAAQHGDVMKKQDPAAPMPGHYLVLRHQDGDSWDYCVIEHLGPKTTIE